MDAADRRHPTLPPDARVYVPDFAGCTAGIKSDWSKEYCFLQNPGEDFYHLLVSGELFVQRGTEKYCLSCALRHGVATRERLYWQKGGNRENIA